MVLRNILLSVDSLTVPRSLPQEPQAPKHHSGKQACLDASVEMGLQARLDTQWEKEVIKNLTNEASMIKPGGSFQYS